MDEQIIEKSEKNNKKCFLERKNWTKKVIKMEDAKKRDKKIEIEKRKKRKRKKQNKKEDTHNMFRKMRYFFKNQKMWKKRGDTRIEHKRDVKHNLKVKRHFIKYKIWRKEINKGIEKTRRHFKNEGFFDGSRRLEKTQNWRCERGTKNQEKERTKNMFIQREGKRNKRNMSSKKKHKRKKKNTKRIKWNREKNERKRL